ncbi:MAG: imidazole glycerol phosphate synthase subunit HisH [Chloroflexi bacterium]|nr:imidazole glycerol phosphate synthase subunit HisH [Chloroflexota bacterium]
MHPSAQGKNYGVTSGRIAVIDSGVANLRSVVNALTRLGAALYIVQTPEDLKSASKIILPGVGAFAAGMARLRESDLIEPLRACAARGVPILGICLGMQMLFERSSEMGDHEGLGLLSGSVVRFPQNGPKVPHVGWNQLEHDERSRLLKGVPSGSYAYFVHSYYAQTEPENILARAAYGIDFPAVVGRGNIYGVQFHPEKSHATGLRILKNFLEL